MEYNTNYYVATHWLHNNYILCNDIVEKDPDFNYPELEENEEIYQYFLTDASKEDVEYLQEHFGLAFGYSEMLDLYVLCVTHFGTSWDYVYWTTDLEYAKAKLGETKH